MRMQRERMGRTGDNLNRARVNIRMRQHAHVEGAPIGVSVDLTGDRLPASREDPPQDGGNAVSSTILSTCRFVHVVQSSKMPATRSTSVQATSGLKGPDQS